MRAGKAEVAARRTEKLARRNPDRLQRQIDDLEAAEASGQPLKPRDKKALEELRSEVNAVGKARDAQGDKAPTFARGYGVDGGRRVPSKGERGGGGMLGKRRRVGIRGIESSDGSETDESVRRIPMPRDTPPPIPAPYLQRAEPGNANLQPIGEGKGGGERMPHTLPPKPEPVVQSQTVYEAKPAVRDLRKEAVSAFIPAVVQRKIGARKGQGKLLEPEEMDRLEREGYGKGGGDGVQEASVGAGIDVNAAPVVGAESEVDSGDARARLEEEEERFERELRSVQLEEVRDEDL